MTLSTAAGTTTSLNYRQQFSMTSGTPTTTTTTTATLSINPLIELRVSKVRRGERPCTMTSPEENDVNEIMKMAEDEDVV